MTTKTNSNKELLGIENITKALASLFDKHRLVFWHDEKQELEDEFNALDLDGIKKIKLANNEFTIKHRLIREEPEQKFLVYSTGPTPALEDNWLLDLVLANVEFKADKISIQLTELGLDFKFSELVKEHIKFFDSKERVSTLKQLLAPIDKGKIYTDLIMQKMLAICVGINESEQGNITEKLLEEFSKDRDEKFKLITRVGLEEYLFKKLKTIYGYDSISKTIKDFGLKLFKTAYLRTVDGTSEKIPLNEEALVLLRRWKDNRHYIDSFETLSKQAARDLDIEHKLHDIDYRLLLDIDYFELIELKIINELRDLILDRRISEDNALKIISKRKTSHWYKQYSHVYNALSAAVSFIYSIENNGFNMDSLEQGITKYTENWYLIDQLYRQFTYNAQESHHRSLLDELIQKIDNLYSNNYLLTLNNHWQKQIDKLDSWNSTGSTLQRNFYTAWVEPFVSKDRKIVVIISDAMRYEIGEELRTRICKEDRYTADLEPAISMLPSYTQLGMAALLPNLNLGIVDDDSSNVSVDSMPSAGKLNRSKILAHKVTKPSTVLLAKEVFELTRDEAREITKANDVIYIYHNLIDHTGDKLASEERVFSACEKSLEELINLIKKMNNANANNFIITADHGFIYQNQTLSESDFLSPGIDFDNVSFKNRRFVIGKNLKDHDSLKKFTSAQLGLVGELEVQIPKSINRLRVKGSGTRFVHGGASLQEIVIPVLSINKKRQSDTSQVDIEVIRGASSIISSGQLAVTLYQTVPVEEKAHPRKLRIGLYTKDDNLISDQHDLVFDSDSDNPRDREKSISLILSKSAEKANRQDVYLKLKEQIKDSDEYSEYKSINYTLRRSFTSDFDL
jgi:uncharacterized protein (TIGR02687 family)